MLRTDQSIDWRTDHSALHVEFDCKSSDKEVRLCMLGNFACFLSSADFVCWFFSKSTFSKNSFRNIIRTSNSLDPDQAWQFVRPELGPNCFKGYQQTTLADIELFKAPQKFCSSQHLQIFVCNLEYCMVCVSVLEDNPQVFASEPVQMYRP